MIDSLELMLIWYSSWLQFIDTWNMVLCIIKLFTIVQNVENLPGGNYCTLIISLLITRVMYVFKKNDIHLKNVACRQNFFLKVYWSNLVPGEWHAIFSFHSTIGLHSLEMEHCWIDYIRFLQPYIAHVSLKYIKKLWKITLGVLTLGSVIVPSVLHYHYAWPASPSITPPDHVCQPGTDFCCPGDTPQAEDADYMEWGYIKPWNRYSPYIVGVLLGYLLHITKRTQIKLSKVLSNSLFK